MFSLVVYAVLAAAVAGLVVKFALDFLQSDKNITWAEYIIVLVVITVIVAPFVAWAGWSMAKAAKLSFNEYWNGWELSADEEIITCYTNGRCKYDYTCNCHEVCTGTGKDRSCHTECDDCPYFRYERKLTIKTTLGDYFVAQLAPLDYEQQKKTWGLPWGFGPKDYMTPQLWADCKARIDAGRPGPVTKRMKYDNFILASDRTILKQYSDMIDQYKEAGLLPPVASEVHDLYQANKVSFVGYSPSSAAEWQSQLMYLNAALGEELQGDLHLVVTQDNRISSNPDAYLLALKAHWQNPEVFGDSCLSKNGIIVVIGIEDEQTVSWARAITGMPLGNEAMLVAMRNNLKGAPLTPARVIGVVSGEFYIREKDGKLKVRGLHSEGVLERILWGLDEPQTKFARVSMSGGDIDDIGTGFKYLAGEIEPSSGQKMAIVVVTFIICMGGWVTAAAVGERTWGRRRRGYDYW
ncbi:MAG: hypothetical protein FJ044_04805 [Candidatus Cloacimonetes bacterium]|nr:hypothetical protein [Candidatus Cloacimonadota bacterium]